MFYYDIYIYIYIKGSILVHLMFIEMNRKWPLDNCREVDFTITTNNSEELNQGWNIFFQKGKIHYKMMLMQNASANRNLDRVKCPNASWNGTLEQTIWYHLEELGASLALSSSWGLSWLCHFLLQPVSFHIRHHIHVLVFIRQTSTVQYVFKSTLSTWFMK